MRPSRPRASARRLAGSMVTTTARRPARAASRARTAAVVVLPTPPEPQHTRMRRSLHQLAQRRAGRPASHDLRRARRSRRAGGRRARRAPPGPISAVNTNGRRIWASGSWSASRATCSTWSAIRSARNAAAAAQGVGLAAPQRGAGRLGGLAGGGGQARRARRRAPFTTTGPEAHADPVLQAEGGVDELVDRGLLGQGDEHHPAALVVGEHLEHVLGLGVDRADPHRVERGRWRTGGT